MVVWGVVNCILLQNGDCRQLESHLLPTHPGRRTTVLWYFWKASTVCCLSGTDYVNIHP